SGGGGALERHGHDNVLFSMVNCGSSYPFAPPEPPVASPDALGHPTRWHGDENPGCNRRGDWAYKRASRHFQVPGAERGCSSVVEHNLAKVRVVGSNPIARSKLLYYIQCLTRR